MGSYKNKRNYGQISLSSHTGGSEAIQYIRFLNAIISNNTFKVTICDLKNKDRNMADNIEHPLRTWAKSGLASLRWRYLHQMNWWKGLIESNQYATFQEYKY